MKKLDEYRMELEAIVKPSGAFVRLDRGDALFVTDAPRRGQVEPALPEGWNGRCENGLLLATPDYGVPEVSGAFITKYLKSSPETADKLARQALAVALREKNTAAAAFISELIL